MKKIKVPTTFNEFEKRVASDLKSWIREKVYKYIDLIPKKTRFFASTKFLITGLIIFAVGIIFLIAGITMAVLHTSWFGSYILLGIGIITTLISWWMLWRWTNYSNKIRKAASSEFNKHDFYELYKELFNKFDGINCQGYEQTSMPIFDNASAKWPLSVWPITTLTVAKSPKFSLECFQTPVAFQLQTWVKIGNQGRNQGRNTINLGLIEINLQDVKDLEGFEFVLKDGGQWDDLKAFPNLKKVVTENTEFNSKFELYSNDQVKARVLFTPYCLETILNFLKELKKEYREEKHWFIEDLIVCKSFDKILIYFSVMKSFLLDSYFDDTKANTEYIVNNIANNIMTDCYQIYAALSMASITSLI